MKSRWLVTVALVSAWGCGQAPSSPPSAATPPAQEAAAGSASPPVASTAKYAAKVPVSVTTPDTVQTRIGTLKFSDGLPDADTVQEGLRQPRFRSRRGSLPGWACRRPIRPGPPSGALSKPASRRIGALASPRTLADAGALVPDPEHGRGLYLGDASTSRMGRWCCRCHPVCWASSTTLTGAGSTTSDLTGPDQGKGGKYLVVPPDYKGELPKEGYFIAKTRTYSNVVIMRAFIQGERRCDHREEREGERCGCIRSPPRPIRQNADIREHLREADEHGACQRCHLLRRTERGSAT